jgi:EAL domain-containing protein (putative c-di-GMP-specific phosphodiesterase class I)
VRFALDDFGTGYSTLTYLKRLPVDVLKIDRSFVHHMLDDTQDRAIVEGVIGLARTFGCTVVAEGVESPAQARTLLDLGCDIGQGTGIAAPMPPAQVATGCASTRACLRWPLPSCRLRARRRTGRAALARGLACGLDSG